MSYYYHPVDGRRYDSKEWAKQLRSAANSIKQAWPRNRAMRNSLVEDFVYEYKEANPHFSVEEAEQFAKLADANIAAAYEGMARRWRSNP
jgi:hypothetical protein